MKQSQTGFTLIELMMVIAIIAILASLAVSVYQTHTVRVQVEEALTLAVAARTRVENAFNTSGEPPVDRLAAGMTAAPTDSNGRYVSGIDIDDGRVDLSFGNEVHQDIFGDSISFTPYAAPSGIIQWRCGNAPAPIDSSPLTGGGVTSAYQAPTVEPRYLPSDCRN